MLIHFFSNKIVSFIVLLFQLGEDELRNAILLIFANKQDLPNAMSVSDIEQKLGLRELRSKKVHYK